MQITLDHVQSWLERYVTAWRTYEPAAIAALFTDAATYAYRPWDTPVTGRDAIVADWRSDPDEPGSWEGTYQAELIAGDRAVATGQTRYTNGDSYANLWLLRFADDGRCAEFVEWYMKKPSDGPPH